MIAAELEDYLNAPLSGREEKKQDWKRRFYQCLSYCWFDEADEYAALLRTVEERELQDLAALEAFCHFMIRKAAERPEKIW